MGENPKDPADFSSSWSPAQVYTIKQLNKMTQIHTESSPQPITKKSDFAPDSKTLRHVSNFPFLSNVLGKMVIDQMSAYCDKTG